FPAIRLPLALPLIPDARSQILPALPPNLRHVAAVGQHQDVSLLALCETGERHGQCDVRLPLSNFVGEQNTRLLLVMEAAPKPTRSIVLGEELGAIPSAQVRPGKC